MKTSNKHYEAPKAEIIEIGTQSMLCASMDTSTGPGGNGFHFGTSNGQW